MPNLTLQQYLNKETIPLSHVPDFLSQEYDSKDIRIAMGGNAAGTATTTYPTVFYNTDGAKQTEHLFAGGIPVATIEKTTGSPTYFWNSQDHLNSTSVVTDSNSNTVAETEYTAFGSLKSNTWTHPEQRKYTGHEYDVKTGLTYAKQRYFDTSYGRFLSEDPSFLLLGDQNLETRYNRSLESFLKDPQELNSYSYVKNNPLKYTDPTGEALLSAAFISLLGKIFFGYSIANLGIDLYDRDIKVNQYPELFTAEEKNRAKNKVVADIAFLGVGKVALTAGEALGVDILTTTLDLADQAGFGSKIYENVNQKYQQNTGARPSIGVSIGSTYSIQQQLDQISLLIQQIQDQISYLQYLQSNNP